MKKYALWITSGIVTVVMLIAGYRMLSGDPLMHADFAKLGLPMQFGTFIGVCEIVGAVAIWAPRLAFLAACGLCCIMCFLLLLDPPLAIGTPAAVVALLAVYVAIQRKSQAFWVR